MNRGCEAEERWEWKEAAIFSRSRNCFLMVAAIQVPSILGRDMRDPLIVPASPSAPESGSY